MDALRDGRQSAVPIDHRRTPVNRRQKNPTGGVAVLSSGTLSLHEHGVFRSHQRGATDPASDRLDLDEAARFYARLGFGEIDRYDGYQVVARGDLELHLSYWEDHDPRRTAGTVYLRVTNAQAVYDDLYQQLDADGCLYLTPASGLTPDLTDQLQARVEAGIPTIRLHEIDDKPWGLREFTVIDPGGNAVHIGQLIK